MSTARPAPQPPAQSQGVNSLADRPASLFDVRACYSHFLGREVESDEAAAGHLSDAPSVWNLINRFQTAPEARRRRVQQVSDEMEGQQYNGQTVVLDLSPQQREEIFRHIETVWSRYGREDAYYSVLTNPRYMSDKAGTNDIEHFYATGEDEINSLLAICIRNGIDLPTRDLSFVELGCGVGRLAEHACQRFARYKGVDISANHLAIARARLQVRGCGNADLQLLPDYLASADTFDFFYSVIVLQHNPPPVIHMLLDQCMGRLKRGGYAYFQVPCYLYDYRFEATSYLAGQGRAEHMEMHALPQRHIFELLARHNLQAIEVVPNGRIGGIGHSYTFFARKMIQSS